MDFHWAACRAVTSNNYTYDDDAHVGYVMTGDNWTETTEGFCDYDSINGEYVLILQKS